jgi:adenylate cyclase
VKTNSHQWYLEISFSIIAWLLAGAIYTSIRFYGTHDFMEWSINDMGLVVLWLVGSVLFGMVYWLSQVISDTEALRSRSYGFLILFKALFLVCMTIVIVMMTRLVAFLLGKIEAHELLPTFIDRLGSRPTMVFLGYVFIVSIVLSFIRQMRIMVGTRVLVNLMIGKYHRPIQETRVFMFLDLKSSTTHAESLGHIRFSQLIQDCFRDLTDAAIARKVEIYQYVGDEAVLSWQTDEGIENANCIHVYFDFLEILKEKKDYYVNQYGFVPEFKAGVNIGPVTVAEIGVLKRDIAFHGEAIIVASRIEGKCNELQKGLLVSEALKNFINADPLLVFEKIGSLTLKGKNQEVGIFDVQRKTA